MNKYIKIAAAAAVVVVLIPHNPLATYSKVMGWFGANGVWVMTERTLQASDNARPSSPGTEIKGVYFSADSCHDDLKSFVAYAQKAGGVGGFYRRSEPYTLKVIGKEVDSILPSYQLRHKDDSGSEVSCHPVYDDWMFWE